MGALIAGGKKKEVTIYWGERGYFILLLLLHCQNHLRQPCSLRQTWPTAEYITVIHGALVYMRRQIDSSSHFLSWRKCHLWGPAMMNAIMWLVHRLGGVHFHLNVRVHARTHADLHTKGWKIGLCLLISVDIFLLAVFANLSCCRLTNRRERSDNFPTGLLVFLTSAMLVVVNLLWPFPSNWFLVVVPCVESISCLCSDAAVLHNLHDAIWTPNWVWLFEFPANRAKLWFLHSRLCSFLFFSSNSFCQGLCSFCFWSCLWSKNVTIDNWLLQPKAT